VIKIVKLFFNTPYANPYLVVICLLLASVAETVGIGTLLPVIAIASGNDSASTSALGEAVQRIIDTLGLPGDLGSLVVLVAVFMILKSLLSFGALAYATHTAARVSTMLRQRLINAIFGARWSYFHDQKSGALSNVMGNDSSLAAEAYIISANVVASAIQAVAYTLIAVAINPQLAVAGVLTGVLMTFTLQMFVTASRRAGYKLTDNTGILSNYLLDTLANIKALKSMHRFDPMLVSIEKIFSKLRRSFVNKELAKAGLAHSGDSIIAIIAAVGIYVASTYLKVPFPELIVSAIVFNQIVYVSARLQRLVQLASRFESSYVRTMEAIETAESAKENNPGKLAPSIETGCRLENVSFSHGDRPVLRDVSLTVPANEITVLSGPSGGGKTTIVDLLIGLHRPATGRVWIGGTPLEDVDLKTWRQQIGYVPQELSLFHANIRENLTMGDARIGDEAIETALEQADALSFVRSLPAGLDSDVGQMGGKLSGGQRQRISLARALVGGPKILILDEVTSALDPETERGIIQNIMNLRANYTIIAVTHRPAWLDVADRLYSVSSGRVEQVDPPRLRQRDEGSEVDRSGAIH
jgi:ATP-binding cassette, subfamily C, bacterial